MIKWREEMSVGVAEIDGDHRVLIAIINEFEACQTRQCAERTCRKLFSYTQSHFQREEAVQAAFRYSGAAAQQREHGQILENLRAIIKTGFLDHAARVDDRQLIADITKLMRRWIIDHVMGEDLKMRDFFRHTCGRRLGEKLRALPPMAPPPPNPPCVGMNA